MSEAVVIPVVDDLPQAPTPADPEPVFDEKAGAFLVAQVAMVGQINAVTAFINQRAVDAADAAASAAEQVGLAEQQVQAAAEQVGLAEQAATTAAGSVAQASGQADRAGAAADAAEEHRDSALNAAAAAGAAAGLPALSGQAGRALKVRGDELGVEFGDLAGTLPINSAAYRYGNDALFEHAGGRWQRVDAVVPYSPELHELPAIPAAARQYVRQAVSGSVGNFASGMHDGASWLAFSPSGIYRSTDRVTWELVSTVLPAAYGRLSGDGARGIHCAISGNGPSLYRSADNMQSWSSVSVFGGNTINDICCSGSIFIAVGASGRIASSQTGQTWTDRGPGTAGDFRRCVWTGEFFIAYRANGEAWKSIDGISWSMSAAGIGTLFAEICTFGGVTYLASDSQISYSSDGVSWAARYHPAVSVKGVSRAGGKLVILSTSSPSKIYSSGDGGDSWLEEQYLYSQLLSFIVGRRDEDVSLLLGSAGFIGDISSFVTPATIRFSPASAVGNFNLYTRTK